MNLTSSPESEGFNLTNNESTYEYYDYGYGAEDYYYYYPYYFYELPDFKRATQLWLVGFPVLFTVGVIGNVLTFVSVIRSSYWKEGSTAIYLTVICVVDVFIITLGYSRTWMFHTFYIMVRELSVYSCKLHMFFVYFLVHYKAWVLVSVVVERAMSLFMPVRHRAWFTRRRVILGLGLLGFIIALVNLNLLISNSIDQGFCVMYTDDGSENEAYSSTYFSWVDLIMSTFGPFVVIVALTIPMTHRLLHMEKMLGEYASQADIDNRSLAVCFLVKSFIYFACNLPICLMSIAPYWDQDYLAGNWERCAMWHFLWAWANFLYYLDLAINFLIFMASSKFRRMFLYSWCCCWWKEARHERAYPI